MQKRGQLLYGYAIKKFISLFPDLQYDGTTVHCTICDKRLLVRSKRDCQDHVNSATHLRNRKNPVPYEVFIVDFLVMLTCCNIPFYVVRKEPFKTFWKKYIPQWDLPSNSVLQNYLPRVREVIDSLFKSDFRDEKIWLTVNKSIDLKKNYVITVLVRILSCNAISPPYLVACKRGQELIVANIRELVLDTLSKYEICKEQVLMLVTDGNEFMLHVGKSLKEDLPNLIHVTCILYALHVVVETVRMSYTDVDCLISSTKAIFHKSAKRVREFQKYCPHIAPPSDPVLTRYGTWLDAVFYYVKNYEEVKYAVMKFNPKEAAAIRESQRVFQNPLILDKLQTLYNNYQILGEALKALQNDAVTLNAALNVIEMVDTRLQTLCDVSGTSACAKFKTILQKNPDLSVIQNICKKYNNSELLLDFERELLCTNITSFDADQSFCLYKNLTSPLRQAFKDTTIETSLMLQNYIRCNPEVDFQLTH